jgi:hypothetical protein
MHRLSGRKKQRNSVGFNILKRRGIMLRLFALTVVIQQLDFARQQTLTA